MRRTAVILILSIVLYSCGSDPISSESLVPGIVGKPGEIVVVMSESEWNGTPGAAVKEVLEVPYKKLPQFEPALTIVHQTHDKFDKFFNRYRTILMVDIRDHIDYRDGGKVSLARDKYARGQLFIQVGAKTWDEFARILREKQDQINELIAAEELVRLQKNFKSYRQADLAQEIRKMTDLKVDMTSGYYVAESEPGFVWLKKGESKVNPELDQWYFVYKTPYTSSEVFSIEGQLNRRDSVLARHAVDSKSEAVMECERRLYTYLDTLSHDGNFAVIMKGLWKIEDEFRGGPFVSLSFLDSTNTYVYTVEGNVYAPHDDKREYMRAMEAIVMTARE